MLCVPARWSEQLPILVTGENVLLPLLALANFELILLVRLVMRDINFTEESKLEVVNCGPSARLHFVDAQESR